MSVTTVVDVLVLVVLVLGVVVLVVVDGLVVVDVGGTVMVVTVVVVALVVVGQNGGPILHGKVVVVVVVGGSCAPLVAIRVTPIDTATRIATASARRAAIVPFRIRQDVATVRRADSVACCSQLLRKYVRTQGIVTAEWVTESPCGFRRGPGSANG